MRILILTLFLLLFAGCDKENEKHIDQARKQTDQAAQEVQAARQEVQHLQRLRDIDRVRLDSEKGKAQTEAKTWQSLLTCLSILLVIVLVCLAREIRKRRVVSHLLTAQKNRKEVGD